ncbi:MAG TPA: DUF1634 domain-containing protein [Ktedonobacterales bacterium]|nr:DUF1634 domain-containing protein [Ktedonobacterales bacterium]
MTRSRGGSPAPRVRSATAHISDTARKRPPHTERAPLASNVSPSNAKGAQNDPLIHQAELAISFILRAGVIVSSLVIALGVALYFITTMRQSDVSHTAPAGLNTLSGIFRDLATGDPQAIIMLGLLLLFLTPVLRVSVSIVAFALERDWRYVVITALVLTILVASFLLGKGGA